jgi:hypothetical protein
MKTLVWGMILAGVSAAASGQVLTPRPSAPPTPTEISPTAPSATVPLVVPAGTPLKVALDKEVRIRHAGQPLRGKLVEPVYAFDKLVLPAGTEVTGKVSSIDPVSRKMRVLSAMNADLTPYRKVRVEFDTLHLADGREIRLDAATSAAPLGVLQFVPAAPESGSTGQNLASRKIHEAKQQARQQWDFAKEQLHAPDKVHRAERLALAQLPYRPQYLDSGTAFDTDLNQPLSFGSEAVTPESLTSIGAPPPAGSVVHATLATALTSATARKGDPVEAVITQPLIVDGKLYAPEGSRLKGVVLEVRPARRLSRNGQLRIVFHQLVPPNGVEQALEANLEAVAVAKDQHLVLDSEGGAQVTTPKTRYLTTGIAVALAAASASPDRDREMHGNGGDVGGQAASGASGYKAVGMILGAFAHSRVLSTGLGVYGASLSVYSHFLARGRDVNYPKHMSVLVALGPPDNHVAPAHNPQ